MIERSLMQKLLAGSAALFVFCAVICAPGAGGSAALARKPEPVRIAVITALTGIGAEDHRYIVEAAELAAEEINHSGGILGRPVELRVIDNQSTPLGSKRAAEEAVEAGVLGVIGPFWSSHALSAAPVLQEARIPMITPIATSPEVTRVGDFIFRACVTDDVMGFLMARFALERLSAVSAVVMVNMSEKYSITLATRFTEEFADAGGEVLWTGAYRGSAVDFEDVLAKAMRLNPQVIFVPGYARDSGLLVKQAANMGVRSIFMGGDGWGEPMRQYAEDALVGTYYSSHYYQGSPSEENTLFRRLYEEKFNTEDMFDHSIPLTYDAVMLFADAAKRALSLEGEAVRNALAVTEDFKGATGTIAFDQNGDPKGKEVFIIRFVKSGSVLVHSMIR